MDTSKLCMYCMEDNGGNDICPHCGKDANAPLIGNHLKPGTLLGGRFLVGRAVGQDAAGVVYIVYDQMKDNKLRIREYLPRGIAARAEDGLSLTAMPGMSEQFTEGMTEMAARAESAEDPSKAMAHFEENGTLYVVLRKKKASAAAVPAASEEEGSAQSETPETAEYEDEEPFEDEEEGENLPFTDRMVALFKKNMPAVLIGLFVVVLLGASVGILLSRSNTDNRNIPAAGNTNSPLDSWSAPTETPVPTAGATDAFGNIIPPSQNWQGQAGGNSIDFGSGATRTPVPDDYEPDWLANGSAAPMNTSTPTPIPTDEASATPIPTETPVPAPTDTPKPAEIENPINADSIDRHSSEALISQLQQRLMDLGWLDIEKTTGSYGNLTKEAVQAFQRYIKDNLDSKMDADGLTGKQTIAWLNRADAPTKPNGSTGGGSQPTDTPSSEPDDEPTATPAPEGGDAYIQADNVDRHSDKKVINQLQQRLMDLGWLDIEKTTGTYGDMTKDAVKAFQRYVKDNLDSDMDADGYAGKQTIAWLNRSDAPRNPSVYPTDKPEETQKPDTTDQTPNTTPTPEVTATPTPEPGAPDAQVVAQVQDRLIQLGWLDASQKTGVYDNATTLALADYQRYLNQINPNADLAEDGYPDENTRLWLNWDGAPQKPAVMPDPTDVPMPSQEPDQPTTPYEVNESSPEADILWLQNKLAELQWLNVSTASGVYDDLTKSAVTSVQKYLNSKYSIDITPNGIADGVTMSYLTSEYNAPVNPDPNNAVSDPNAGDTQDPNPAPGTEGTVTPEPDKTVVPEPTTEEPTPEPTETPEPEPTETPEPEPTETPEPEPTETPEPEPTETPEPEPTEPPEPEPTETPEPEPTTDPNSYVDATSDTERITALQQRLIQLGWLASGSDNGSYDSNTQQAVQAFQQYLNDHWDGAWGDAASAMPGVNGQKADRKTLNMLNSEFAPAKPNA